MKIHNKTEKISENIHIDKIQRVMYIEIGATKRGKIMEITKNNQIGTTKQKILVLSHIL